MQLLQKVHPLYKILVGLIIVIFGICKFFDYYFFSQFTPESDALIIMITPTYKRPERLADMTRLTQTLMHVNNLHWIVVEDGNETSPFVEKILVRSGIFYTYLKAPKEKGLPPRGWSQRNFGLAYIREMYSNETDAVVYFGDDDNTYDIRLFDFYIRNVVRIGIWAVGLVAGAFVEAPRVNEGKVVAWDVVYHPDREFATDMAGFAINLREILRTTVFFGQNCAKEGEIMGPESCFLQQFGFKKEDLEPFGYNDSPKEILVWHTRTTKTEDSLKGDGNGYVVEDMKTNITDSINTLLL